MEEDDEVFLVNNIITKNGSDTGSSNGFGIERHGSDEDEITLLNNLICGNRLGELDGDILDAADSANLTPTGTEGVGVLASPGCEIEIDAYDGLLILGDPELLSTAWLIPGHPHADGVTSYRQSLLSHASEANKP